MIWHTFWFIWGNFKPGWFGDGIKALLYQSYYSVDWLVKQSLMFIALRYSINFKHNYNTDTQKLTLYILAGVYAANAVIKHLVGHLYIHLKVGGRCQITLREVAVRTMLQLTEQERERFPTGEVSNCIDDRIRLVTFDVWARGFVFWKDFMLTLTMVTVSCYVAKWVGALICAWVIIMNLTLAWWRVPHSFVMADAFMEAEDGWKNYMMECALRRPAITAYRYGQKAGAFFKKRHGKYNKTDWSYRYYIMTTEMFSQYIAVAVVVTTYVYFGTHVITDGTGIYTKAKFILLVGTIIKFDSQIGKLFDSAQVARSGFNAVSKLAELLNAGTVRKQLYDGRKRRMQLMAHVMENYPEFKEESLFVSPGTSLVYKTKINNDIVLKTVRLPPDGLNIELGQMLVVNAGAAVGKATFLKMLARQVLPTDGFCYYPENLRVRYISSESHLFDDTVMANLRFGGQHDSEGNPLHSDDEVWEVCKMLGISDDVVGHGDRKVGPDGCKLSASNRTLICVARALLSSVDLLLLANALDALGPSELERVMKVLSQMVTDSGINVLSAEKGLPACLKKKKTVVVSSAHVHIESFCDNTISLESSADLEDSHIEEIIHNCDSLNTSSQVAMLSTLSAPVREKVLEGLSKASIIKPIFD